MWKQLGGQVIAAIITALGTVAQAIIEGFFILKGRSNKSKKKGKITVDDSLKDQSNKNKKEGKITVDNSLKEHKYNTEDYVNNSFIPNINDLENEKSDDKFAEGLAIFWGFDRSGDDIYIKKNNSIKDTIE